MITTSPTLYVGPWRGDVSGPLWNATGFSGAELGYAELLAAGDPVEAALDFCRTRARRSPRSDPTAIRCVRAAVRCDLETECVNSGRRGRQPGV